MISVEEARDTILSRMTRLEPEHVGLLDALGRVLAEDVTSDIDVAPFDNSAMDGYAVRADDTSSASADSPVRLRVIEHVPAGSVATNALSSGEAVRIMTGAPIPENADAVVMVEDTRAEQTADGETVLVARHARLGDHIRRRGEEVRSGDTVLTAGETIGSAAVGLLAAAGREGALVYRRPRVAIVSTGDELVDVHEKPGPGKIRNTNSWSLAAQVLEAGGQPFRLGIARDTEADTRALLSRAPEFDLMLTSGGVSVGDYDVVKDVLGSLGEMSFWKVAMRPGAPLTFGEIGGTPLFGLPGNPTATMVGFELFVRPSLRLMQGHSALFRPRVRATLEHEVKKKPDRRYFLRGLITAEDGRYLARLAGSQSSALLTAMHRGNCLLVLPEGESVLPAGAQVECIRLDIREGVA